MIHFTSTSASGVGYTPLLGRPARWRWNSCLRLISEDELVGAILFDKRPIYTAGDFVTIQFVEVVCPQCSLSLTAYSLAGHHRTFIVRNKYGAEISQANGYMYIVAVKIGSLPILC